MYRCYQELEKDVIFPFSSENVALFLILGLTELYMGLGPVFTEHVWLQSMDPAEGCRPPMCGRASHSLCPGASRSTSSLSNEAHPVWPGPRSAGVTWHCFSVSLLFPGMSSSHSHFWSGHLFTMYWASPRHWPQEGLGGARKAVFCCWSGLWVVEHTEPEAKVKKLL